MQNTNCFLTTVLTFLSSFSLVLFVLPSIGCSGEPRLRCVANFRGHIGSVEGVAFTPDGQFLVTSGDDGVRVWDVERERQVSYFEDLKGPLLAMSPDGSRILTTGGVQPVATGRVRPIKLSLLESGETLAEFEMNDTYIRALAFSPDGKHIAAGTGYHREEGEFGKIVVPSEHYDIWMWDIDEPDADPVIFRGHLGPVRDLLYSPDGVEIISVSIDRTMRVWNVQTQEELHCEGEARAPRFDFDNRKEHRSLVIDPDGQFVIRGNGLWNLETREIEARFPADSTRAHDYSEERLLGAALVPGNSRIVSVHKHGVICLWDVETGELICEEQVFRNDAPVFGVAVSPDGRYAATVGEGSIPGFESLRRGVRAHDDNQVKIWRLPDLPQE